MVSGSDRHASRWHHGFRIPGAEELTLDHAYRAMAWLGEEVAVGRTTTDAIEEDLSSLKHFPKLQGDRFVRAPDDRDQRFRLIRFAQTAASASQSGLYSARCEVRSKPRGYRGHFADMDRFPCA
jgi:hypothetical protein